MYFFANTLLITLLVCEGYATTCSVCVTEVLLTSPVNCPLCKLDDINKNGKNEEQPYYSTATSYKNAMSNNLYDWTTCFVRAPPCDPTYKYRSFDGSCNNLKHPTWGMTNTSYSRILLPYYRDAKHEIALASDGKPRPPVRILSTTFFKDRKHTDHVPLIVMQWGQIVAHDITITPSRDPTANCCEQDPVANENVCVSMPVLPKDYFYSRCNITCLSTPRSNVTVVGDCRNQVAQQINGLTHPMDASLVYGSSLDRANYLREFKGGRLRTQKLNDNRRFLPNVPRDEVRSQCTVRSDTEPCCVAGDIRVNQNTQLTTLQNVLLREHNRIAGELEKLQNGWDDETLFQETRAILIATMQHITYKEWLVYYIGDKNMRKFKLYPKSYGYTVYNDSISLITINSFAAAAYRVGHSGIEGYLRMLDYHKENVGEVPISDWMNRPLIVEQDNHYDQFLLGLLNQPMEKFDKYFTTQMTDLLFHGFNKCGQDLESLDIVRGRDHGLGRYIDYLEVCTGEKAESFKDLKKYISKKSVYQLKKIYNSPKDIDLFVGGMLETPVPGTRAGPTFLCIITEQFYRKKWADRFWYEVGNQTHSFTADQLSEIRKASLSRLVCDNSDNISYVNVNSFSMTSSSNPQVSCSDIPKLDLHKWKI